MIARWVAFSARNRLLVLGTALGLVLYAVYLLPRLPLDALPDLSDTQVIVLARWEQSPELLEAQVTYPIMTSLLGTPRVKAVRATTDFGFAFLYTIFEDGTDPYWARSRVLELLARVAPNLPPEARVEIGPDATGVGWVFQYILRDTTGRLGPAELRTLQDFYIRYAIQSVPGVAEVASFGGYPQEIQITVDPVRLQGYGLSLGEVLEAARKANQEGGGRLIEWSGAEAAVRIRGWARSLEAFRKAPLRLGAGATPLRLGDVAHVGWGPQLRRGASDFNGLGEHAGGIVVARHGENAKNVIARVRARFAELALPEGVEWVPTYDRSELIDRTLATLKKELLIEMAVVAAVILIFLWHVPSAVVPIVTLPLSVLLAFIPLYHLNIPVNLMSLAGIAISLGVLVDGAILEVENAYNRIHDFLAHPASREYPNPGARKRALAEIRLAALQEVAPAVFLSLLLVAVSFFPIFALVEQEGRLFRPLAWSKNLTMLLAALLAVTVDPALRMLLTRVDPFDFRPRILARFVNALAVGTYRSESEHPVAGRLQRLYEPVCRWTLRHPKLTWLVALALFGISLPIYPRLGREFVPALDEGTILYMPTTVPGISIAEAQELLVRTDRVLRSFPEVLTVHGKAGRAETATDPAPLSMLETTVVLRPRSQWRRRPVWYERLPEWTHALFRPFQPDRITREELIAELNRALQLPGLVNAWTQPIRGRIDMLSTGMRTPVGLKLLGSNLEELERVGQAIEGVLRTVPGTRTAFAERTTQGLYVDIRPNREALARYGLSVADFEQQVAVATGGAAVTTVVEGRNRFPVTVRYGRELRDDLSELGRILVKTPSGGSVPLEQIADVEITSGPSMIRSENGLLASYVYIDVAERDLGSWVDEARERVARAQLVPPGVLLVWSGQYEHLKRAEERMQLVLPLTLALIVLLLVANTGSLFEAGLVLTTVPFSAIGALWLFGLLDLPISTAAWVGLIALLGLDAETGVFMLQFLKLSWKEARTEGRLTSLQGVDDAIVAGAAHRIRPKAMTVAAAFLGLLPILFSTSTGADLLQRIAAPMIGGLITSFAAELLLYPCAFKFWKLRTEFGRLPPELPKRS